jgi:ABC-type multidrug transport system permease subunit
MRSVLAVAGGMLVAFVLVLLIVFGIFAPVLSWLFQIQPSTSAVRTFAPILLFVCGLSFYFGGMAAAFKAPDRHRLHGTLVAPAAFVISPVVNLLVGKTPFPGIDSVWAVLLAAAFLAASVAAAYVGSRRGQALQAHNDRVLRSIKSRKSRA